MQNVIRLAQLSFTDRS